MVKGTVQRHSIRDALHSIIRSSGDQKKFVLPPSRLATALPDSRRLKQYRRDEEVLVVVSQPNLSLMRRPLIWMRIACLEKIHELWACDGNAYSRITSLPTKINAER